LREPPLPVISFRQKGTFWATYLRFVGGTAPWTYGLVAVNAPAFHLIAVGPAAEGTDLLTPLDPPYPDAFFTHDFSPHTEMFSEHVAFISQFLMIMNQVNPVFLER
jgi:hypothetical protein